MDDFDTFDYEPEPEDVEPVDFDEEEYEEECDDSMDGDAESALASCGWGTDEDYGGDAFDVYDCEYDCE